MYMKFTSVSVQYISLHVQVFICETIHLWSRLLVLYTDPYFILTKQQCSENIQQLQAKCSFIISLISTLSNPLLLFKKSGLITVI